MVRVYTGSFQMPDADVEVSFEANKTTIFKVSNTQNVMGIYSDVGMTSQLKTGVIGTEFYVKPTAPASGYQLKDLTVYYSVLNSEKTSESKEVSEIFNKPTTDLWPVKVSASSMNNSVRIVANYEPIA